MFQLVAVPSPDFDCIAIRREGDVVVCVSDSLLSPRGARVINTVLTRINESPKLEETSCATS